MPATETFTGSEDEAVEQLRAVLSDAVRSHMISDVPLGAFLSGGVDSSLVVGLMSEALEHAGSRPSRSASTSRSSTSWSTPDASPSTSAPSTTSSSSSRTASASSIDSVSHFDEPFADSSAIPTWYVSEMARRHVTVVLSGDGGDELFGGYDRYLPHPRVAAFDRYSPRALRRVAAIAAARMPHGARGKNFLRHVGRDEQGRYLDAIRFFGADEKPALLTPESAARDRRTGRGDAPGPAFRALGPAAVAEPDDALRRRDLPARRHPDQGRSHEHGALDRIARAAAR